MDDVWKALTVVVAGCVAWFTWLQYRIHRERLRLDPFKQRVSVFEAARRLLVEIIREGQIALPSIVAFRTATAEAAFLFGEDVTGYLDELDRHALALRTLLKKMEASSPGDARDGIVDQESADLSWLADQLPVLPKKFLPYLKFRVGR